MKSDFFPIRVFTRSTKPGLLPIGKMTADWLNWLFTDQKEV
jgi:hypothetical protein